MSHGRALIGLFILLLAAALPAGGQPRDTVVVALPGDPDNVVPGLSRLAVAGHVRVALLVGLIGIDADWQPIPRLAREVPTMENGQWRLLTDGGMELRYRLKPGAKWHDGAPVTAADVVFAWDVAARAPAVAPDPAITEVTAPDADTVVVTWRERRPDANLYEHPALPRHLLEAAFRRDPASVGRGSYADRPVGNGPYRVVEWQRGRQMRLRAVEDFVDGPPAIPNVVLRFVGAAGLPAGEDVHVDFTGRGGAQFETVPVPGLVFEHIALNLDSPPLRDRRVRQALLLAIDRDGIRRQLGVPLHEPAHSWLPPWHRLHYSDRRYAPDPEASRRLLAEAGWTPGPDGVRRLQGGERLDLVFMTTPGVEVRERTQDLLIAQWRAVGVAVRKENPPNFFEVLGRRQFPHLAMFAWVMSPTTSGYDLWHSSRIPSAATRFQGTNYSGWRHEENDRVLDEAARELNAARRAELYRRQQALWAEELPALPLWFRVDPAYIHRDLRGVRPTGIPGGYLWNIREWAWR